MEYYTYPSYLKTDMSWLKEIPSHWKIKRLRFVIHSNPVKSEVSGLDEDELVSFVPMEAVTEDGEMVLEIDKSISDVYSGYTYFKNNDVVLAKITPCFENGKGAIAKNLTNGIGFGTTEFHVLRTLEGAYYRWLYYLTICHPFRALGASEMLGAGGQKRVPETFIKNFRVGMPSFEEQIRIADFLDHKIAQIDRLIEKKKALIEKLNEKRIALITQAVTKGLNPDAPMKPSGVDWLGDVPAHWDVRRLRFAIQSNPVKSQSNDLVCNDMVSFVPMDAVGEYGGMRLDMEKPLEEVYDGYTYFRDNDVVIAKITPCFENGKGAKAEGLTNGVAFGTTELHVMRPLEGYSSRWLFYLSICHSFREIGASEMYGAGGQKRVPESFIKDFRIGIPNFDEQESIADFIDSEVKKMDEMLRVNHQTIERLTEYRTALITAAVTGKIDVSSIDVPDEEAA
jgi:type I restriction enzyme S subunit